MTSRTRLALGVLCAAIAFSTAAAPRQPAAKKAVSKVQRGLFDAAKGGHAKDVERALAAGAKVDGPDEHGVTAITYAIVENSFNGREVLRALLKAKASVNVKSEDGMTPLMFAARNGKNEHFGDLLAAGADVNALDNDNWTALMCAAFYSSSFCVTDLLKAGADPKVEAADGKTAVLLAVQHGNSTSVEALLAAGATFESRGLKHTTPLVLAAIGDDMGTVERVLKAKPDVNGRDKDGVTALMVAANRGNTDTLMALLRAGADVALKTKEGQTALDIAKESKCEECAALLGEKWEKRRPSGGTTFSVPCDALAGTLDVNVKTEGADLVWSVFYPKPVGAYLGGFSGGAKKISADVEIYLDVDNNPKTGLPPTSGVSGDLGTGGAEYVIGLMEIGTSVRNEEGTYVNRQVLDPSVSKGEERLGSEQMNGWFPKVERDLNAVRLGVPLSVLGLKSGAKIRVTVRPGFCAPKSKVVSL
ncbi:MAG TPA: ankyrin repeat domain-containing protein [Thermoanaerobaculia bacterium]